MDYFWYRKGRFSIPDLYLPTSKSQYYYKNGVNPQAVIAFVPSAVIALVLALVPVFGKVAPFGWFIGAALGATAYFIVTRGRPLVDAPVEVNDCAARAAARRLIIATQLAARRYQARCKSFAA